MRSVFKNASLRMKILAMIVVMGFAITGIATVLYEKALHTSVEARLDVIKTFSDSLQSAIGDQFFERYGDVQAFALNSVLQTADTAKIQAAFNSYVTLYGIYDAIVLVDLQGKYIASNTAFADGKPVNTGALRDINFAGEEWHKAAIASRFTEDATKGFAGTFVSQPMIDNVSTAAAGKKMYGNAFTALVKTSTGAPIGVITARAGIRWIDSAILSLHRFLSADNMESAEITLLDKSGVVLAEYDPTYTGSKEISYDLESTILKVNLAAVGDEAAKKLVAGESGVQWATHAQKKIEQGVGFTTVKGSKFIESLGWSVMIRVPRSALMADLNAARLLYYASMAILALVVPLSAFMFSTRLARSIEHVTSSLDKESVEVSSSAGQIAQASTELSEAATEQASALQETVAAVDEISAMVTRNAETAKRSAEVSNVSRDAATRGKKIVGEMIVAIGEINSSNTEISAAMDQSNREISEIVRVIGEIGDKTKVINDIVFQTKLLSFNASVEAARAGEHGKGFAVVAEEVGNLAQMSGNAAKEISAMLEGSIEKVERIVEGTKTKVGALVQSGRDKAEAGTKVARECGESLDAIQSNVEEVNQLVAEIASASQEQAQGIQEVTKAMGQLDQVTHQNSAVATQTATAAESLNAQSESMKNLVVDLRVVVQGNNKTSPIEKTEKSKTKKFAEAAPKSPGVGKVVSLAKHRKTNTEDPEPASEGKRVVGSDISVPLANDPRFNDI